MQLEDSILTGSQNLLLLDQVSQTLAGRTRILNLYPFSLSELEEREPWDPKGAAAPPRRGTETASSTGTGSG